MDENKREIQKIIKALTVMTLRQDLNLSFLLDALSSKLTRRQAIILRLILLDYKITQVEIAKLLGYSTPTINMEMYKIRLEVAKIKKWEGKNYFKYLKRKKLNDR